MKVAKRAEMERALRAPAGTRFFLLYGPDEAGSRALTKLLGTALGDGAERVDLTGKDLKEDPARLADEAGAFSMFGDKSWILVDPAGDECTPALEALLDTPGENAVALVAGALKPASKLLKLALGSPHALAFASYVPERGEAGRLVIELGRAEGLLISADLAQAIAEGVAGNRAVIAQELAKYALYVGADPSAPVRLERDMVDAIGASADEGDLGRLVDAVLGGDPQSLERELDRLGSEGLTGVPLVRAVLRRLALLARLRAAVDGGSNVPAVMASQGKSLFWKDKDAVASQLGRWRGDWIARAIGRLLEVERQLKNSGALGPVAADEELFALARQAARAR